VILDFLLRRGRRERSVASGGVLRALKAHRRCVTAHALSASILYLEKISAQSGSSNADAKICDASSETAKPFSKTAEEIFYMFL
jgi:hypothetical protein